MIVEKPLTLRRKNTNRMNMMRRLWCGCALLALWMMSSLHAMAQMEDAKTAVANMRVGWNLGNTLDSNSGEATNMWIEAYSSRTPKDYETAWGQPQATKALIHMFKEAGFNAIRVPVTWYPHYGTLNNVGKTWDQSKWSGYTLNSAWLKRVKQVVDYVIDEGMYCILNVHHDTGNGTAAWIRASMDNYEQYEDRYTRLWTAIATQFKDYDDHLLFEGYNEMTDKYGSWCFASFASDAKYNAADAADAYKAVNSYAQDFVAAVRATGGNNEQRNLVVNTYAACSGAGSWNMHLQDPLKQMAKPLDDAEGHLIFQVHSYWNVLNYNSTMKSDITTMFTNLYTYLAKKHDAPVIVGEWGSDAEGFDYSDDAQRKKLTDFATYFMQRAKARNMACFYWMGLSDGKDRSVPQWTQPELVDAIIKGYYGAGGYIDGIQSVTPRSTSLNTYNLSGQPSRPKSKEIVVRQGRKMVHR